MIQAKLVTTVLAIMAFLIFLANAVLYFISGNYEASAGYFCSTIWVIIYFINRKP